MASTKRTRNNNILYSYRTGDAIGLFKSVNVNHLNIYFKKRFNVLSRLCLLNNLFLSLRQKGLEAFQKILGCYTHLKSLRKIVI